MNNTVVAQQPIERSENGYVNIKVNKYTLRILVMIFVLAVVVTPTVVLVPRLSPTTTTAITTTATTTTISMTTAPITTEVPYILTTPNETVFAIYNTVAGCDSTTAVERYSNVTGQYYHSEQLTNIFDDNFTTVHASFGNCTLDHSYNYCGINTGFYLTLENGLSLLQSFRFGTRGSFPALDPLTVTIEGSNSDDLHKGSSWTLIYNGKTGLTNNPGVNKYGELQILSNSRWFLSYRFLVTSKRDGSHRNPAVEYAELQMFGYEASTLLMTCNLTTLSEIGFPIYDTVAGGDSTPAIEGEGDAAGQFYYDESPERIFDDDLTTVYTNFGNCTFEHFASYCGINTGFYVTLENGLSLLQSFRFGMRRKFYGRDPLTVTIEGSNSADITKGSSWTLIYSGKTGLMNSPGKNKYGELQTLSNSRWFTSYRFLVTSKRNAGHGNDAAEYAELQMFGYETSTLMLTAALKTSIETVFAIYHTFAGGDSTPAIQGYGNVKGQYYQSEPPISIFDGNLTTVYTNFGYCTANQFDFKCGIHTGFYWTANNSSSLIYGFRFGIRGLFPARDPLTMTIEGSNSDDLTTGSSWTLLYNGKTGLLNNPGKKKYGELQIFPNSRWFKSYRFLVTSKRNAGDSNDAVEYAELQMFGYEASTSLAPSKLTTTSGLVSGIHNTVAGGDSTPSIEGEGDAAGQFFYDEGPTNIFDDDFTTVYTSFGNCTEYHFDDYCGINTGFYVTFCNGLSLLQSFRFGIRRKFYGRDPLTMTIEGSNSDDLTTGSSWTLLYNGKTGLMNSPGKNKYGELQTLSNSRWFTSYRFLVTSKRNAGHGNDAAEYAELQMFGYETSPLMLTADLRTSIETIFPIYNTVAGGDSTPAIEGYGNVRGQYYQSEPPISIFDDNLTTVYINFGNCTANCYDLNCGIDTGFYWTANNSSSLIYGFRFGIRGSIPARDPLTVTIEGSNSDDLTKGSSWTLIYSGDTGLSNNGAANEYGELQAVFISRWFLSYRFLVTSKRNVGDDIDAVEYAELQIFGYEASTLIPPSKLTTSNEIGFPIYDTVAGGDSIPAIEGEGDAAGQFYYDASPEHIFDDNFTTVYTSFGNCTFDHSDSHCGVNTGVYLTLENGLSLLQSFRFGMQRKCYSQDPLTVTIEGSNSADLTKGSSWTLIYSGKTGLMSSSGANTYGELQTLSNSRWFTSYRFLVTSKRNVGQSSNSVQYTELEMFGYEASTLIPSSKLTAANETVFSIYNTVAGGDSISSIVGYGESPERIFDDNFTTVYTNFGNCTFDRSDSYCGINTGFYLTLQNNSSLLQSFRFGTQGKSSGRDPLTVTIEGSNSADLTKGSSWTLIYSGKTGLMNNPGKNKYGDLQTVSNSRWFTSYRFLVTSKRNVGEWSNSVEYAEILLLGYKLS